MSAGELSGAQAERAPGTAERSPSRPAGPSGSASKLSADLRASGACPLSCGRPDHLGDGLRTFTRAVCAAPRDRAHRRWNRSPNASAARSQRCFHAAAPQVCCVLDVAILQPSQRTLALQARWLRRSSWPIVRSCTGCSRWAALAARASLAHSACALSRTIRRTAYAYITATMGA